MRYDVYLDRRASIASSRNGVLTLPFGPDSRVRSAILEFYKYRGHILASDEVKDILDFGTFLFYLDKYSLRDRRENWIRSFKIHLQLRRPEKFKEIEEDLKYCLNLLSGDNFSFEIDPTPFSEELALPIVAMPAKKSECVALLSGGIDSVAGALQALSNDENPYFLRVETHDNASLKPILDTFKKDKKDFQIAKKSIVAIKNQTKQLPKEDSQRIRSFYFISVAMFVAYTNDIHRIMVNENGIMAVHIPLDLSRTSSFSTKTVYPPFIDCMQTIFRKWADFPGLIMDNLWKGKTKAEVIGEFRKHNKLNLIKHTVSCAHASIIQSVIKLATTQPIEGKDGDKHCGYCFPCLLRRISVSQVELNEYDVNYCTDPFFAVTQSSKKRSVKFIQDASSAAIGLLRFVEKFSSIEDGKKIYSFPEIAECYPYYEPNGVKKIIDMHAMLTFPLYSTTRRSSFRISAC